MPKKGANSVSVGQSVQGRALETFSFGDPSKPCVLFLGAVHGDEVEGIWLLEEMIKKWKESFPFQRVRALVFPTVNPDGAALKQRWNANRVDLNRNLPTKDWTAEVKNPRYPPGPAAASEPENKALIRLIETEKPVAILSAHSFSQFQVNANGPSLKWAKELSKICSYPVTEDIGYPTPGSLGTYAGKERAIPTITLEIERGIEKQRVLSIHVPVIEAAIEYWDQETK
jgi:protein MpaA